MARPEQTDAEADAAIGDTGMRKWWVWVGCISAKDGKWRKGKKEKRKNKQEIEDMTRKKKNSRFVSWKQCILGGIA